MLTVKLNPPPASARRAELLELAKNAERLKELSGSRAATEYLLNGIGTRLSFNIGNSYYSLALDYHLGVLYAHLGDPDRARAGIERSGVLAHSGGYPIFADHVRESLALHESMMAARTRGMPSVLIASMPRSASASLTLSLAATMDAPIVRLSAGEFPNAYLMLPWLTSFMPGGAVTHDHFGASPFNLSTLEEAGVREVFVLVRDPRAAAASAVGLDAASYGAVLPTARTEFSIVDGTIRTFIPWLIEWLAASRLSSPKVRWLKSHEVRLDMAQSALNILESYRHFYPAVEPLLRVPGKEVRANFVVGDDSAWRLRVSPAGRERLWDAMPSEIIELLELER